MKVLVTGGSGFIGTNLLSSFIPDNIPVLNCDIAAPLSQDHQPSWRRLDILDLAQVEQAFEEFNPTHVVHLAASTAVSRKGSAKDYRTNTTGTENLLKVVGSNPSIQRLIVTSTMLVCRPGHPSQGDEDYSPTNAYGESKVEMERMTRRWRLQCPWSIIRPTTIWGPWHLRLKSEFFALLRRGLYVHPNRANCMRSYGFVGNAVDQIRGILTAGVKSVDRKTFYIGDPAIRLVDYVDGFSRQIRGREARKVSPSLLLPFAMLGDWAQAVGLGFIPLTTYRLSNMTQDNVIDLTDTLRVVGQPRYTLEQGISITVEWLRATDRAFA